MIYVARHGQTVWNQQNKVCGRTNIDLSDTGIGQAKILARMIAKKDVNLIISSPLNRAVETSKIVSDICSIPIKTDVRLIEQDYGVYEGTDRKNIEFLNNKRNFACKYPQGESMLQVAHRVYGLLDEIIEIHKNENILLISHGGVCRIINTYFRDMTNEEFFNYSLGNGQLEEYQY